MKSSGGKRGIRTSCFPAEYLWENAHRTRALLQQTMQSGKPSQPAKSILKSYYVTDRNRLRSGDLISAIGQALGAGGDVIQLRGKGVWCGGGGGGGRGA